MNIFLTGATGFLGGKLVSNLLLKNHNLFLLARDIQKAEKLKKSFSPTKQKRITIIEGDVTEQNLGIDGETIEKLKNKIEIFYHLAALVKFDLHLSDVLFDINYKGTQHSLEFADSIKVKKFLHTSTAYTVGKKNKGIEELYEKETLFNNPYEFSKSLAEKSVFDYKNKMDVSIFRPSIIVGDSKTGEADSEFTLYGFMRALEVFKKRIQRRHSYSFPTFHLVGSKSGTSNFVPVNYVADILALGSTQAVKNEIYHITNPTPPTNHEILSTIKESLDFDELSIYEKDEDFELTKEEKVLNDMISIFNPYLDRQIIFDDRNTQKLIKGSGIEHLNMTPDILHLIVNTYYSMK